MSNSISIKGIKWTFEAFPLKKYKSMHGSESVAITDKMKKELHFIIGKCDIHTIRHEVLHAFVSSCCIDSADLDADAIEEIGAEIQAWHHDDIGRISKVIYKRLNK